jgi:hypothetical protein
MTVGGGSPLACGDWGPPWDTEAEMASGMVRGSGSAPLGGRLHLATWGGCRTSLSLSCVDVILPHTILRWLRRNTACKVPVSAPHLSGC